MSARRIEERAGSLASKLLPWVVLVAAVGGCSQPGSVQLSALGANPVDEFTPSAATVAVGTVVAFSAQPQDSSGKNTNATVTASVDDTTVAQVVPASWANEFVIIGEASGHTVLHVYANGDPTATLPVSVFLQGDTEP